VVWVLGVIGAFGFGTPNEPVPIHCDNQAAIALTANPGHRKSTKHIDIRYHWVRDQVVSGSIELRYVGTKENKADMLTKPLAAVPFTYLRNAIRLTQPTLQRITTKKGNTLVMIGKVAPTMPRSMREQGKDAKKVKKAISYYSEQAIPNRHR
jgi:predicted GNAT family acetyltransferase